MSLEADRAGVTIEVGLDIHPLSFDISVRIEPPFAGSTTVCQDFHPALTILDAHLMVDRGNVMDYSLILGVVDWVVSDMVVDILISSEERRGGKECVRTCRSRGSPLH